MVGQQPGRPSAQRVGRQAPHAVHAHQFGEQRQARRVVRAFKVQQAPEVLAVHRVVAGVVEVTQAL
jgi:hypothetical protein